MGDVVSARWRATYPRMQKMNEYNLLPPKRPSGKNWFLNGHLVRVYHVNRAAGMITLFDLNDETLHSMLTDEWVRKRITAWKVTDTAKLLNRHPKWIPALVKQGVLPPPTPASVGAVKGLGVNSYYSEDQIYEMRDICSERHKGNRRKDGLITNNEVPSLAEMKRAMGLDILQYTKSNDGNVIPIWRA